MIVITVMDAQYLCPLFSRLLTCPQKLRKLRARKNLGVYSSVPTNAQTVNKTSSSSIGHEALTVLPLIHSVARELEAIAEPQPKVLNLASTMRPWSSTFICRMNSRHHVCMQVRKRDVNITKHKCPALAAMTNFNLWCTTAHSRRGSKEFVAYLTLSAKSMHWYHDTDPESILLRSYRIFLIKYHWWPTIYIIYLRTECKSETICSKSCLLN